MSAGIKKNAGTSMQQKTVKNKEQVIYAVNNTEEEKRIEYNATMN